MVLAQFLIATPIVVGFTTASFQALSPRLPDLLMVLGAGRVRTLWLLAREAKLGLLVAIMAAFGAIVSEVGASMIVGGNLERSTRVLTTAIVTETSRGERRACAGAGTRAAGAVLCREPHADRRAAAFARLMDVEFDGVRVERDGAVRARHSIASSARRTHDGDPRSERIRQDDAAAR